MGETKVNKIMHLKHNGWMDDSFSLKKHGNEVNWISTIMSALKNVPQIFNKKN